MTRWSRLPIGLVVGGLSAAVCVGRLVWYTDSLYLPTASKPFALPSASLGALVGFVLGAFIGIVVSWRQSGRVSAILMGTAIGAAAAVPYVFSLHAAYPFAIPPQYFWRGPLVVAMSALVGWLVESVTGRSRTAKGIEAQP